MQAASDDLLPFTTDQLAPGLWRLRAGEPEAVTPVALSQVPPRWQQLRSFPLPANETLLRELTVRSTPRGLALGFVLDDDEDLFGGGLQLKSFCQTGKRRYLKVNSDPVADTGETHAPVPWLLSSSGYGLYIDTARYLTAYLGSHRYTGDVPVDDLQEQAFQAEGIDVLYGWRNFKPRRFLAEIPFARGVDLYLFRADHLRDVVRKYILFSGGGCLPPLWDLGILYRVWGKSDQAHVKTLAAEFRSQGLPCDVIGLEPGWHSHSYSCTYDWNRDRFPDPAALLNGLREADFKVNLWEHAFVHPQARIHQPMQRVAGDISVWDGLVPDLTLVEARELFLEAHCPLVEAGIAGFKLDECDNSDYLPYPWSYPDFTRFPGGLDGEQMHQLMGWLYQQTLATLFRRFNRRGGLQVRSSYALAAPYSGVLYSDLYQHVDFIRGVVNAGISGLLWTPEVRQCASMEDLIRRLQTVVLSGSVCVNAWMIPHPPWKQFDRDRNRAGEFLPDAAEWTQKVRGILELRMALLPYLYTAFANYHREGIPPVRPLILDYPELEGARECDDQWMLGESLLVAPLVAGQSQREVLLPPGRWWDLRTGHPWDGGRRIVYPAPLLEVPVFVEDNTLLPLARPVASVNAGTFFDLTVHIYGSSPEPTRLYGDDGESFAFENGTSGWLDLSYAGGTGRALWTRGDFPRRYRVMEWLESP